MNTYKRNGNRWTVNEVLSLQREYELLGWTIQEIAGKHERTVKAILFRLETEGFIDSWKDARGFDMESYNASFELYTEDFHDNDDNDDEEECCDNDSEYFEEDFVCNNIAEVDKLSERIWSLESSVSDIKYMVTQIVKSLSSSNKKKLKPLRKQNF